MNYAMHYARLMDRARGRVLGGYVERHHVVPVCLGGSDRLENLVALTPEEHYVAHQLLVKMHPGNGSLIWAASCMTGKSRKHAARKNKLYGWLRRRLAVTVSRRLKGQPKSIEHRAALAAAKLGKKRGPHSAEHRANQSKAISAAMAAKGRAACLDDPQYRLNQSETMKALWARRRSGELPLPIHLRSPLRG